jgi:hypothetical protein
VGIGNGLVFAAPDNLQRSVWVVVDPRDFVTGQRMTVPVQARLKDVTDEPIAGLSGVYCFMDLDVAAGPFTAQVTPRATERGYYFDGESTFTLAVIPVPGQPLARNPVVVELLPRPAYPFADKATLARGRLVRTSDGAGIAGARIVLILETVVIGRRGQTDERGEFVVCFPPLPPEDIAAAVVKDLNFELRFEVDGEPPFTIPPAIVREGTTLSVGEIQFPGV